jgi:secreted trypsin-like serine protease
MIRTSLSTIVLTALALWSAAPAVSAQESTSKGNWMFEYVELRRSARTLRATADRARRSAVQLTLFEPRIVGGQPALAADNPFQVALLMKAQPDNFRAQYCGGTLITPTVVVTAAHCSDFVDRSQVQVLTRTRRLDGSGTRHDVASIAVLKAWDPVTFDNDVAIWRLTAPATGVTLATLASAAGAPGVKLLATGWGALTQGGQRPVDLMKVQVPVVEQTNCNDANSYNGAVTDRMICAGLDQGEKDTCQGDSGGPLTGGDGNNVLNGITSWGQGCAQPNLFGVYTNVAHPVIREFIERNSR